MAKANPARKGKQSAPTVLATPMADFLKLEPDGRCLSFAEKANVNRVSFVDMGKLHVLISDDIAAHNATHKKKSEQRTIYGELRKLGVNDKSISNAAYAARAWRELVIPELISEAQFDSLTFMDCFRIAQAMSDRAALQLDAPAVAELMSKQPDDFDKELHSLYEHGITVAEKKAQDEAEEAARIAALVAAQTPAPAPLPPAPSPAPAPASASQSAAPPPQQPVAQTPSATTTTATQNPAPSPSPAPAAPEPSEPSAEHTTEVEPINVTVMPDQSLPAMLEVIGDIQNEAAALTTEGRETLIKALREAALAIETAAAPESVAA